MIERRWWTDWKMYSHVHPAWPHGTVHTKTCVGAVPTHMWHTCYVHMHPHTKPYTQKSLPVYKRQSHSYCVWNNCKRRSESVTQHLINEMAFKRPMGANKWFVVLYFEVRKLKLVVMAAQSYSVTHLFQLESCACGIAVHNNDAG